MLAEDIRSRVAGKQFGFDKLHPTTYLTGPRWMDEIAKPAEEIPEPKFDTRNFTEEQRREWVLYELLRVDESYSYGLLPMAVIACGFNYFKLEAV